MALRCSSPKWVTKRNYLMFTMPIAATSGFWITFIDIFFGGVTVMTLSISSEDHDLIVRIYDTVLHQDSWTPVLDAFAAKCAVSGATLMLGDMAYPEIQLCPASRLMPPEFLDRYFEQGTNQEEVVRAMANVARYPARTWISDEDAWGCPWNEIAGNRFLDEHIGLPRRHGARLNDSPIWLDGISINYTHEEARNVQEACAISQPFLPHMAKALEISRPFLMLQARFQAVLSVLDRMRIGILIVSETGTVIVSNARANETMGLNDGVSLAKDKRVTFMNPEKGDEYRAAVAKVSAIGETPDQPQAELIMVPKRSGNMSWLLEVVPLTDLQGDIGQHFQGAAVFIIDPERKDVISTRGMKELYNLTGSEADVCEYLANGLALGDIAETRGTTYETTRAQIKSLFAKTGVNSQAELVRRALQVNLPIDDS